MKTSFLVCFPLLWAAILFAQSDSEYLIRAGEGNPGLGQCRAIVIAPSGLKLRNQPGFKASTIAVIPFGKEVSYTCDPSLNELVPMEYDADSVEGTWLKVFWRGNHGYAFSAYLGNGILKMKSPFYLLEEESAWCWDDAFISSEYNYYGVYTNADTTVLMVKKLKPIFFSWFSYGITGITFSFKQSQRSLFAFASREQVSEKSFSVKKSNKTIENGWDTALKCDVRIPKTNWEIKIITEKNANNEVISTLIIRDITSGAWHYLVNRSFFAESVTLLWSGDMDGDGIQDFMIDVISGHTGGKMLFLSKNRGKNEFIRLAGRYFLGDCC